MLEYVKYGISIRTTNDAGGVEYYVITVTFNEKWNVIEPQDERVRCVCQTESKEYVYFTEIENGIDIIFDSIDATIAYNEDIEKKLKLLREKVVELQELFANETYETLQHLTFVIGEQPKKRGRKPQQKKDTPQDKEEPQNEPEKTAVVQSQEEAKETPAEGKNKAEANDIDAKIAAAMNKNKKIRK